MTTTMTALNSASIRHAEFVRMSIGDPATVYTFCNAAGPITVSGITFTGLGSLLSIGDTSRELKSTSVDMSIVLTGIDPAMISLILGDDVKGAVVEIWRGFLDSNNQIITSPTTQFFKRYSGIVNSVGISESWDNQLRSRVATCSVACSSMRKVLENRIAGLKTNESSWRFFYPTDASMDRTSAISNTYFDFGKAPIKTESETSRYDVGTDNSYWNDGI